MIDKLFDIQLINGSAFMIAKMEGAQPIDVHIASNLDDSQWHRLSMQISEDQKLFRVEVISTTIFSMQNLCLGTA